MTQTARMKLVNEGRFKELFVEELFWDQPDLPPIKVEVEGVDYDLEQVAGFAGLRVWLCRTVPGRRTQRLIDKEVRKTSTERFLIFADDHVQEWRWLQSPDAEGAGQPRLVMHRHLVGTNNEALAQRLSMIEIEFSEELTIIEVLRKMRRAFDADQIARRFYSEFIAQQQALAGSISGIPDEDDAAWYSALMMNRLMFIYFMQRKGFMDNDPDYLRNRLDGIRSLSGARGRFYSYYKSFLIPLFHEGLGQRVPNIEDADVAALVGDVRYINGGIFSHHELELSHEIEIPDESFDGIFRLFDGYQWHLDDREGGTPTEINPDVLGYIFEQFINQKQMGAYYTKEDVTHFMASSTVLPTVLEHLDELGVDVWSLVSSDPERYVWEGNFYGRELGFPADIESERTLQQRPAWGSEPPSEIGLAGESWWEVESRRDELGRVLDRLRRGEVRSADEAVTQNLDLETLAVDAIDSITDPELVFRVWTHLSNLRIVDPTCGSGAFLFAALKVLLPLYAAVLDAAHASGIAAHEKLASLIDDIEQNHPNPEYFLLKHASLSNLYGVDIMKEAVEVARLRLFLKLISAIDEKDKLEPLPDLDFNIKCGNILVGAYSVDDLEKTSGANLFASDNASRVVDSASRIAEKIVEFRLAQELDDDSEVRRVRAEIVELTEAVREDANRQYFAILDHNLDFEAWVETHQPFHWFIEFPGVFQDGGFDVVIGNPPYINKTRVTGYTYKGFRTDSLPDIYAPCTERAAQITKPSGRLSLIVPISCSFGDEYRRLREVLRERFSSLWVSNFSRNPAALFASGIGVRSTILVGSRGTGEHRLFVTKTHRWYEAFRPSLFETLHYFLLPPAVEARWGWVRIASDALGELFASRFTTSGTVGQVVRPRSDYSVGFKNISLYWLSIFLDDPPAYERDDLRPTAQTKIGRIKVENEETALLTLAILASKLAFVWWYCTGDDFDVTAGGLHSTPVNPQKLSEKARTELTRIARQLIADFPNHLMFTPYAGKWMGNFVISEMRDITDQIDAVLAEELGYQGSLSALELAYACCYKPTGERPGTIRTDPSLRA